MSLTGLVNAHNLFDSFCRWLLCGRRSIPKIKLWQGLLAGALAQLFVI